MATALSRAWRAAGKPLAYAKPIADLAATLRRYGYVVYIVGNDAHMDHNPPEDHCPFSTSGWPVANPYPWIHACDIMTPPPGKGLPSLGVLGGQLVDDRIAGYPGAAFVKFLNWTPLGQPCRHESWQPDHRTRPSSDVGHIHVSARTDMTHSDCATTYDPVARVRGEHPAQPKPQPTAAPAFVRNLKWVQGHPVMAGGDVRRWQQRIRDRGWKIAVDGEYGPDSQQVCRRFQADKHLRVDGVVGPVTWAATWLSPVT